MKKQFFYDKENDIFAVHKEYESNEKFKGNLDMGHIILDMSTKGRIRGIEIMNATVFFKDFEISESMLENLEDVKFNVAANPHGMIVTIMMRTKKHEQETAKIAVPVHISKARMRREE